MRKNVVLILALLALVAASGFAAEPVTGLWRGIDDKSGLTSMFIMVYQKSSLLFGRMLVTHDENGQPENFIGDPDGERGLLWEGDPYYAGMDVIWNMEDRGNRWKRGSICDPEEDKIYASEMWMDGEFLKVRGKIGPFGRNQTWERMSLQELPANLTYYPVDEWVPVIPIKK